jgi:hypothetical protein
VLIVLKDPLIHFLVLGGLLFGVLAWQSGETPAERIVISAEQVARLRQSAALLEGVDPASLAIDSLVEPAIRDEVYYREALALGLDVNDDEVRRRLVEKMQYLTQDLVDPEPATDQALRDFYLEAPARFLIPERVSFDQVFFSPGQRGESVAADAEAALTALGGGADPASQGDRTPLESRFVDAVRERVQILFGQTLTDVVFSATPGAWLGPYESDFGLHVVRVVDRKPPRQPPFEEIEAQVREVYAELRRREANENAYAEMRARYDVVVETDETARP